MQPIKPGIQTTEFWVSAFTIIGLLTASVGGAIPGPYGVIAAAVSSGAYAISRGLAKKQ